jgi:ABC-2 type transport system ATP-binding protein
MGQDAPSSLARLAGVTVRYGDLVALEPLDLELRAGEVFGLLGPNGAGKTTSVRVLVGLLVPDSGTVTIAGRDMGREPLEARRRLAFVPDGAPLYKSLSPLQHLALTGRLHGQDEERIAQESARLLAALELDSRASDPVGQFSHGMRQKTALACALLARPALLVLDEPLSGLDAPTAAVIKEVLRGWADRGGTVLYTSHQLDVVERVCDRMAILDRGKLVALGDLAELRALARNQGTLEQVFATLTRSGDASAKARDVLGTWTPQG